MDDAELIGPLPMEQWEGLSERERSLQAIADNVGYWLKYTSKEFDGEITADTHVWLNGYDGAPPHWPSVGQLKRWLMVLRASPELASCDTHPKGGDAKQGSVFDG